MLRRGVNLPERGTNLNGGPNVARVAKEKCSVEECIETSVCKGMCRSHYDKFRRHEDPLWQPTLSERKCDIPGCDRPYSYRGMCSMHVKRKDPLTISVGGPPPTSNTCSVDGCERKYYGNGYCGLHRQRVIDTGSPGSLEPRV